VLLYEVFRYHNAVLMLMMTTGTMVCIVVKMLNNA